MCYVCLGDRIDLATGEICPRCKGSGTDPDPLAYVSDRVEARMDAWETAWAILAPGSA